MAVGSRANRHSHGGCTPLGESANTISVRTWRIEGDCLSCPDRGLNQRQHSGPTPHGQTLRALRRGLDVRPSGSAPKPNTASLLSTTSTSRWIATRLQPVAFSHSKSGWVESRKSLGESVDSPHFAILGKSTSVQECSPASAMRAPGTVAGSSFTMSLSPCPTTLIPPSRGNPDSRCLVCRHRDGNPPTRWQGLRHTWQPKRRTARHWPSIRHRGSGCAQPPSYQSLSGRRLIGAGPRL